MEDLDSKDIYLRKDKEIIGLHSVGHKIPYEYVVVQLDGSEITKKTDFMPLESWGNEYNEEFTMIGRGSFRLFTSDIDDVAKEFEADGWTRFERNEIKSQIVT